MKYKLIIILFAFLLASCGKTNEKKDEANNHENGTAHTECCEEHEKPQQESFEVEADSSTSHVYDETDEHDHDHEHNSNSTHKH